MTTPTLLDAARRMLQEGETAPGWGQYHGDNGWSCTYCDNHEVNPYELDELADYRHADDCPVPIFRAAIAREEERQEIIDALVEAARHDAVIGERWACWGCGQVMPAHLPDCGFKAVRAALARYDAMEGGRP